MTVPQEEAPANFVPAAAVILQIWTQVEASGIASVEVKFVDIRRNTSGEGDLLDL
jgi:hypothetical protein